MYKIEITKLAFNGKPIDLPVFPSATDATVQTFILGVLSRAFSGRANTEVQNAKAKGKDLPDRGLAAAMAWLANGMQGQSAERTRASVPVARTREDLKPIAAANVFARVARAILLARNPQADGEKKVDHNKRIDALLKGLGEDPLQEIASRACDAACRAKGVTLTPAQRVEQMSKWIVARGATADAIEAELNTLCLRHGIVEDGFDDFDFNLDPSESQ